MAEQLGFALITPYALMKSRTGGIIGRLMVRTGCELVGTRMIAPSAELAQSYADLLRRHGDTQGTGIDEGELLSKYVEETFTPDPETGKRRRVMLLIFQGEDAIEKVNGAIGCFSQHMKSADSVRDTYGDLILDPSGKVTFIEPAAISSPTAEKTAEALRLWVDGSENDGGILENVADVDEEGSERTLVMLKPDNFRVPSARPGTIIDIFSGSGLRILAAKVDRMSIAEALEFYGPVRPVLREKLKPRTGAESRAAIEKEMGFALSDEVEKQLGELVGPHFGEQQFNELVQFMTGVWLPECPESEYENPGKACILALVYSGPDAVKKIRNILGPTDPSKAAPGSVRREYGQDVMINAAHASDSPDNAQREMGIIKVNRDGLQKLLSEHGI